MNNDTENEKNKKKAENTSSHESFKKFLKEELADLRESMENGLLSVHESDDVDLLREQTKIMSNIMFYMLSDSCDNGRGYSENKLPKIELALRAQNQYRQTMQTLSNIEIARMRSLQLRSEMDRRWQILHNEESRNRSIGQNIGR